MSEQGIPAPPPNPHWLMGEPDLLPLSGLPGRDDGATHGPLPAGVHPSRRPRMPRPQRSGYEEVLAARSALRTSVERAHTRDPIALFDLAAARAPAVEWAAKRQTRNGGRLGRSGLVLPGLLATPVACLLLAFAWIGLANPPRGGADAPPSPALARPGTSSAAAAPFPDTGGLVLATRNHETAPWTDDAAPAEANDRVVPLPAPGNAENDQAAAPSPEEGSVFAAEGGRVPPPPATVEAAPEAPWGSASSVPAATGLAEGEPAVLPSLGKPAFAARERDALPLGTDAGLSLPPIVGVRRESEAGSAAVEEEREAEIATRDLDAAAPATGFGAREGDATAALAAPAATEPASDAPPPGETARAELADATPPAPPPVDAAVPEPQAQWEAPGDPALVEARDREPAPPFENAALASSAGGLSGSAREMSQARPDPAERAAPAAVPDAAPSIADPTAGTGTAAVAVASGGAGAVAPSPLPQQGPRMAAAAVAPPPIAALPPVGGSVSPAKPRPDGPPTPPVAKAAARGAAAPAPDARCRSIILKAQLGEELIHAERNLLRSGCGARR